MQDSINRRSFLKLGSLVLTSGMFGRAFPFPPEQEHGNVARVTIYSIDLRSSPKDDAPIIGQRFRDQLVHIYQELTPPDAPKYYNPLWYKVWGGYLHSAYLQPVELYFSDAKEKIKEVGELGEITVPYSFAFTHSKSNGWEIREGYTLYYSTTHWVVDVIEGPDNDAWYKLQSEIDSSIYYIPAKHLRIIPPAEYSPISEDVPAYQKKLVVSLGKQIVSAFEYGEIVKEFKASTGIPTKTKPGKIPTNTPEGEFHIRTKLPSKHMGAISGNPDVELSGGFRLPGVPWTSFFTETGVAFHGTYWHNNFGVQMSHGCVNLKNEDAKWIFRWTTPHFITDIEYKSDWERRGFGTTVIVE